MGSLRLYILMDAHLCHALVNFLLIVDAVPEPIAGHHDKGIAVI